MKYSTLITKINFSALIVTLLFFFGIFVSFISPLNDTDMPWHLKTGEYILHHHEIPIVDPFSFVETEITNLGSFILRQYWLSQITLWLIFKYFGTIGLILLIPIVCTIIAFIFWRLLGQNSFVSFFIVGVYYVNCIYGFHSSRPQLFTFLFTVLTMSILCTYSRNKQFFILALLPIIFLLWSNMHGGYIFGFVILGSFVLGNFYELLKSVKLELNYEWKVLRNVFFISFICFGACYFNPNKYEALIYAYDTHSTPIFQDIMEYGSPLNFRKMDAIQLIRFWLTVPLSVVVIVLGVYYRRTWASILVFGTVVMSMIAIRYFPFLIIVTCIAVGDVFPKRWSIPLHKENRLNIFLAILFLLYSCYELRTINSRTLDLSNSYSNPQKAINFLKENDIRGNIYGSYNKSGYLILGLYPDSKLFWSSNFISAKRYDDGSLIGGRYLEKNMYHAIFSSLPKNYGVKTQEPLKEKDLDNYQSWLNMIDKSNIDIFVHEALNEISGKPNPLVFLLMERSEWIPVYFAEDVVVFLKDIPRHKRHIEMFSKEKSLFADQLINEGKRGLFSNVANFPAMIGYGLLMKGDLSDNTKYFISLALERTNNNYLAISADQIWKRAREKELEKDKVKETVL